MSSNFSRTQIPALTPAGTRPRAGPDRAPTAGEIMTVDVNFIESTPLATNRDAAQAPTVTGLDSADGGQTIKVDAMSIAATRGMTDGLSRYAVAVPVPQLEMELT